MRKAHILKKIKGTESKNNWIWFDTETKAYKKDTNVEYHKLHLGIAHFYRLDRKKEPISECLFRDTATFADFIDQKTRKNTVTNVMSLNLAFDFTACNLSQELKKRGYTLKQLMVESKVCILKYRKDKQSILFLDLFNYVKASVKQLGDLLDLPKLDVDFTESTDEELITYCRRDVEIISKFMIRYIDFVKEHDLGCLGPTTPSQAFNAFRHKFMTEKIYIHNIDKCCDLERASYFGGRTECHFIGKYTGEVRYVDVNSMYPYVMRDHKFPVKMEVYDDSGLPLETLVDYLANQAVIAEVELDTDEPAYPVRYNGKLVFPTGRFRSTICSASLKYALKHNHLIRVKKYAIYKQRNIFREYVDFYYNLRLKYKADNNGVFEQLSKLFLTSLYGKFGQRVREIIYQKSIDDPRTNVIEVYSEDGKKLYDQVTFGGDIFHHFQKQNEGFNSFVAVASHVTDYARMLLYSMMQQAGPENVLYNDTDSMFLTAKGYKRVKSLLDNKKLGYLALEDTYTFLHIHGLKDYESINCICRKGVRKNAKQVAVSTFEQLQFPSFKGLIRAGLHDEIPIKTIRKTLKREYNKGIVTKSGRVKPFVFNEF